MSKMEWTDQLLEAHLGGGGPVSISPDLRSRTLASLAARRPAPLFRHLLRVAAAALALLLLVPATLLAMGEPVLGIQIRISDLRPEEWFKQGFRNWVASPGAPEFLSPEETTTLATFPIRTPTWLPEGMSPVDQPRGYFANSHRNGKWEKSNEFYVSQGFGGGEEHLSIQQGERRVGPSLILPPGTQQVQVAGFPAFLRTEVPYAKADEESEVQSKQGILPEIVAYLNTLTIWVEEENGSVTEIRLSGSVDPETLTQIAESLFTTN